MVESGLERHGAGAVHQAAVDDVVHTVGIPLRAVEVEKTAGENVRRLMTADGAVDLLPAVAAGRGGLLGEDVAGVWRDGYGAGRKTGAAVREGEGSVYNGRAFAQCGDDAVLRNADDLRIV